jgi:membrane protein implicated in regulation of membrane protease activity
MRMGIADSTFWWLLAGACIVLEMVTGTFYLLMLALGFVAAALLTYLGLPMTGQIAAAAVVGGGAVAIWYAVRSRRPVGMGASANPDVNLDIGEIITVDTWSPDGTASVNYRGARWTVVQRGAAPSEPGQHRVVAVVGNRLMVDKT